MCTFSMYTNGSNGEKTSLHSMQNSCKTVIRTVAGDT